MKQAQRKAHRQALKKVQKERRKKRRDEPTGESTGKGHDQAKAPPAPQTTTEDVMETTTHTTPDQVFAEDEVRNALRGAMHTVLGVMRMVNNAIQRVNKDEADAVFAERITAQHRRDKLVGIRGDEAGIMRVHPLFALWKLAHQCAKQVENLMRLTNPREFAKWKAEADKLARDIGKLEEKAQLATT